VACELSQTQLHAYFDGECDAVTAAAFEKHLESCPECQHRLEVERSLRRSLQKANLYERAPNARREKLLGSTAKPSPTPVRAPARPISWGWLAAAAVFLLAIMVGWRQFGREPGLSSTQVAAATLVDAHLRSLQPGHLTDVESTDQHTVKPWFEGRLDFAPPVRDFAADGFPLLGGRLDVVEGRTAAALVYGRRKHIINVFVEKSQPQVTWNGSGTTQGYQWTAWQDSGFSFFAVSDVSAGDLEQLKQLFSKN
jgi:anti-sigma factor (TIGR02949 family)